MTFEEVVDQAIAMLQRRGRVTYRLLKRQFSLDDESLEDLKEELIYGQQLAIDEDSRVLVWTGAAGQTSEQTSLSPSSVPRPNTRKDQPPKVAAAELRPPDAERRQITVMFCDLVGSTPLSQQLDPEELRDVVRAYQQTCADVVQRFDGHIAQLLGDALLVYFGWPQAHEDDAQRAVRTGLGMLDAMGTLNTRLEPEKSIRLAMRVGIHTGLVVVGEMGGGGYREQLALGDTPNIASRLQSLAGPDTVVISNATFRLIEGYFTCQALGAPPLKGVAAPMQVYQVVRESTAPTRFEMATARGLTPLVGREGEVALLLRRWEQVQEGEGQVVLLVGEAGIGKSRLTQTVRERVVAVPHTHVQYQCSPFYSNSAFYPFITQLEWAAQFEREEVAAQKLAKLEALLALATERVADVAPLFASLLSTPTDDRYPPLELSPQRQKELTIAALVEQLVGLSRQQPVFCLFEDMHWSDPTSLEVLDLLVSRVQEARVFVLITFRPEVAPRWDGHGHVTLHTLNRLSHRQSVALVERVTSGKALPPEVLEQIVVKTDGVPLFVEELTKTVLESGLLADKGDRYDLSGPLPPLAIPVTLQDSLMARLDRFAPVKAVAQIGAALGREFSYELLAAVVPMPARELEAALQQLVDAELLFRRGQPPEAHYIFKHALVQDAAYASLLRSHRQQLHTTIAEAIMTRFPETADTRPELLAHHYTEAGVSEKAVGYWHQAGQQASARSGYVEAIAHLRHGLEVLTTVPETTIRIQHELQLQRALGEAYTAIQGYASREAADAYTRARELCEQLGDSTQMAQVLFSQWGYYLVQGDLRRACALGEELLRLAQRLQAPALEVEAHWLWGSALSSLGDLVTGREHLDQDLPTSAPQQDSLRSSRDVTGTRISALCFVAWGLWCLGYPDQAQQRMDDTLHLAHDFAHPFLLAVIQGYTAVLYQFRGEVSTVLAHAEATVRLASEQGFAFWVAWGMTLRGWALALQDQEVDGIEQMRQGLAAYRATGAGFHLPWLLPLLIETYSKRGDTEAALALVAEGLNVVNKTGGHQWEAELYRLQGELLLHPNSADLQQAEACLQQALAVAHRQQAKSLELRAAMSLSRLWQRQNKYPLARGLLAPVYNWFTEGCDTADLRDAKALLQELES